VGGPLNFFICSVKIWWKQEITLPAIDHTSIWAGIGYEGGLLLLNSLL